MFLSDPLLQHPAYQSLAAEVFFEGLDIPSLSLANEDQTLQASLPELAMVRCGPGRAPCSDAAAAFDTCLIIDSGYDSTRLWPYLSGYSAPHLGIKYPLGTRLCTAVMHTLLHDCHVRGNHRCCWRLARYLFESFGTASVDLGVDSWRVKRSRGGGSAASSNGDGRRRASTPRQLVEDGTPNACTKHQSGGASVASLRRLAADLRPWNPSGDGAGCCCLLCHPSTPGSDTVRLDVEDILAAPGVARRDLNTWLARSPDLERALHEIMGEGEYLATELMFQPRKILPLLRPPSTSDDAAYAWADVESLARAVWDVFSACPIDYRRRLYSNVVVLGGLSTIPHFARRLAKDIQAELFGNLTRTSAASATESLTRLTVQVYAPSNPVQGRYASWIGLRALARCNAMRESTVTREQYGEYGGAVFKGTQGR